MMVAEADDVVFTFTSHGGNPRRGAPPRGAPGRARIAAICPMHVVMTIMARMVSMKIVDDRSYCAIIRPLQVSSNTAPKQNGMSQYVHVVMIMIRCAGC